MNLRTVAIGSGFVVAAAMAAAMLIGPRQGISGSHDSLPRIITVSGTGEVKVKPDMATITTGVTSDAPTAKAALAKNNVAMTAVLNALKAAGISDDDIQTSNFSVSPMYAPVQPGQATSPQISSYQVSNQVTARVKDLGKLGGTLDALVQAGSNQIGGITFDLNDPKATINEARKNAVADAHAKAELYAAAAGTSVGGVVQISDVSMQSPMPVRYRMAEVQAMDGSVPIAAGQNTVSTSITVTYELR